MKHLLCALLMLSMISCQKENRDEQPPTVEPAPTPAPPEVCKVATIREYPVVDGKSVLRTFTYDASNRVTKLDIQDSINPLVSKTISYNADSKIEKITYTDGSNEVFAYSNGLVTGWESFTSEGQPNKKAAFTLENGKIVRENHYDYDVATSAYVLKKYFVYEWDTNGNIGTIKTYDGADVLTATDTYAYHLDKLNKQQTITPQMELLFMNWSTDITAFINSNNLLSQVTSKKRNLVYETNTSGWVTAIKSDKKDNLFTFTYGCSN